MAFPCRLVCYTLFSVHASFFAASTSPSFHRMVARAWVLIFFTAPFGLSINYNLAARVPLTAIPNRESRGTRPPCESRAAPSSPSGETSARSANTPCGARLLCAPARSQNVQKALKGCGGKQEFSPTSNTSSLLSLSSETVRWTVSEAHYTAKL